jgi:hypothetical protein
LLATTKEMLDKATKGKDGKDGKDTEKPKTKGDLDGFSWCWSHGICTHTSKNCKFQKEGHKANATFKNPMKGSDKIGLKQFRNDAENTPPATNA